MKIETSEGVVDLKRTMIKEYRTRDGDQWFSEMDADPKGYEVMGASFDIVPLLRIKRVNCCAHSGKWNRVPVYELHKIFCTEDEVEEFLKPAKEMTVDEVSKLVGCKVKIVGGAE